MIEFSHKEILRIVRRDQSPAQGWRELLSYCRQTAPDPLWDRIPQPETDVDVEAAETWLSSELQRSKVEPRGLYLGLDTLNMRSGKGTNVALGVSADADPANPDTDFSFNCNWYGSNHLIRSLVGIRAAYNKKVSDDLYMFVDYALFLGYGGFVLAAALAAAIPTEDFVAVWGFHDGDLFPLARRSGGRYQRLATG